MVELKSNIPLQQTTNQQSLEAQFDDICRAKRSVVCTEDESLYFNIARSLNKSSEVPSYEGAQSEQDQSCKGT